MTTARSSGPSLPMTRLASMDAYRGLVMFLMMAEILHLSKVAESHPGNRLWQFLALNQSHVAWFGCTLHDLIQPSFSFLVGVALPYSLASREARGESSYRAWLHAGWRAVVLILLGVFLRSVGHPQTRWTFEDTLSQIGMGYLFLFWLGHRSGRVIWGAFALIIVGYWLAFVLYPVPGPGFDYGAVGVPPDWPHHQTGVAAHFNKNSNLAWAFDTWFLNLFPRVTPFTHNGGGYSTLSFIPTLGTMILGLIAGRWLRANYGPQRLLWRLVVAGLIGITAGLILHYTGICPVVKRIWTPGWTIFSGGCCFLLLAAFYYLVDLKSWRKPVFPLVVIGMNSIAIYVIVHLIDNFVIESFKVHFGREIFNLLGAGNATLLSGGYALLVFWLILYWMYRRKLFIRI
ncbi:MAG: acyltransferase family protein [Blastocatellia bacterium]